MFDRNKSGDYVTRTEAQEIVSDLRRQAGNSFVSREDAASFQQMFSALEERVQELEALASQLRGSGVAREHVAQAATRTTDALTKSDASAALAQLKREGAEQFAALNRQVRELADQLTRASDRAATRLVDAHQAATAAPVQGGTTGVDYGAVAFGLSQIKRDVANALGSEVRTADLAAHYAATVQYFADVFAKSDPEFDADLFKQQAGA